MLDFLKRFISGKTDARPQPVIPRAIPVAIPVAVPVETPKKKRSAKAKTKRPMTPKTPKCRYFHSKVAGISHQNSDGSSRQKIAKKLSAKEQLTAVREPDNKYDENAIALSRTSGHQVGYIAADVAEQMVEGIEEGYKYFVFVKEVTGAGRDSLGVNIMIFEAEPGMAEADIGQYIGERL